jgi:hypothetical protein
VNVTHFLPALQADDAGIGVRRVEPAGLHTRDERPPAPQPEPANGTRRWPRS